MKRLVLLVSARRDLTNIAFYIEENGGAPSVTERWIEGIIRRCEQFAELDGTLGTDRAELRPGLRSTPHGNYVIFFRYTADTLEIVNILHGSRDIAAYYD